ncbi:hypothetical protein [Jeotgalibacillus campisalis]|uniref:Competence protein n=1 Tax=Jeotgalibacillus campisalis TaxID=220754 RepID=A0A0C2RAV8_9BACL|nr:hypothetical protein [Jeotgalibacillus campisalis]KIL47450.1 hypothetical protein KR50_16170 [Jeotgalibacillus campisalis]
MGKGSKSKRFTQQGKNAVAQHDQRIPYHSTYAESAKSRSDIGPDAIKDPTLGGF